MKSALVTGANKSIGLEVARKLAQEGIYVYLGSRSLENGVTAVNKLLAEGLSNVEAIQLDVTNDASVENARAAIGKKTKTPTGLHKTKNIAHNPAATEYGYSDCPWRDNGVCRAGA